MSIRTGQPRLLRSGLTRVRPVHRVVDDLSHLAKPPRRSSHPILASGGARHTLHSIQSEFELSAAVIVCVRHSVFHLNAAYRVGSDKLGLRHKIVEVSFARPTLSLSKVMIKIMKKGRSDSELDSYPALA